MKQKNTMTHETVHEMLSMLINQGMTPLEAVRQFGEESIKQAVRDELADAPGFGPLFEVCVKANQQKSDEKEMEKAVELWMAGWTSEKTPTMYAVMQWYWRSPPKGKGKLGRFYWSTNQAWMALKCSIPSCQ